MFNPSGSTHRGGISRYRKPSRTVLKKKPVRLTFMQWVKLEWIKAGERTDKWLGVQR